MNILTGEIKVDSSIVNLYGDLIDIITQRVYAQYRKGTYSVTVPVHFEYNGDDMSTGNNLTVTWTPATSTGTITVDNVSRNITYEVVRYSGYDLGEIGAAYTIDVRVRGGKPDVIFTYVVGMFMGPDALHVSASPISYVNIGTARELISSHTE